MIDMGALDIEFFRPAWLGESIGFCPWPHGMREREGGAGGLSKSSKSDQPYLFPCYLFSGYWGKRYNTLYRIVGRFKSWKEGWRQEFINANYETGPNQHPVTLHTSLAPPGGSSRPPVKQRFPPREGVVGAVVQGRPLPPLAILRLARRRPRPPSASPIFSSAVATASSPRTIASPPP
jgi:hypothetical protein